MPGRARQPKNRGAPARSIYRKILTRSEKARRCEGGHVTRLVRSDKDLVIMVKCIDTVRTYRCATIAPSLGSKRPIRGRHGCPCPPGSR